MAYTNVSESKNLRRHRRYAVDAGSLQVSWLDTMGRMKTTRTRALNISEQGIALELPEAALPGIHLARGKEHAVGKYVTARPDSRNANTRETVFMVRV